MSIKQLNRDFAATYTSCFRLGHRDTSGAIVRRDIAESMRQAEQWAIEDDKDKDLVASRHHCYFDVIALVRGKRIWDAAQHGVRIGTTNITGLRRSRDNYLLSILRYKLDPSVGWRWVCPVKLHCDLDLHWKGLIERDKWNRFIKRLNSVCAEASIFAHAFRHGA
jgi:hypothetical protein